MHYTTTYIFAKSLYHIPKTKNQFCAYNSKSKYFRFFFKFVHNCASSDYFVFIQNTVTPFNCQCSNESQENIFIRDGLSSSESFSCHVVTFVVKSFCIPALIIFYRVLEQIFIFVLGVHGENMP